MAKHHCAGKIKEKQGKLKEDKLRKEAVEQAQKDDVTFHTGDSQMEGNTWQNSRQLDSIVLSDQLNKGEIR